MAAILSRPQCVKKKYIGTGSCGTIYHKAAVAVNQESLYVSNLLGTPLFLGDSFLDIYKGLQ